MVSTYGVRPYYRNLGLVGTICYTVAALVALVGLTLADTKPTLPLAACLLIGGLFLLLASAPAVILASFYRERLTVRGETIEHRGVFRERRIPLRDVNRVRWRPGVLTLWDEQTRLTVDFSVYDWARDDRETLVRLVRSAVDPEVQSGWDLFAFKTKYGLPPRTPGKVGPDEILLTRSRWDRYFVPFVVLTVIGGVANSWVTGNHRWPVLLVLIFFMWGGLRFLTPPRGEVAKTLRAPDHANVARFLIFLLLWGLVPIAALSLGARFLSGDRTIAAVAFVVVWLAVLLHEAAQQDRRTARRDREAAELAAKARGERGRAEIRIVE